MRFQAALAAATTLTGASAFLITPEIADSVEAAKNTLSRILLATTRSVEVQCHECPAFVAEVENGAGYGISGDKIETTIHLDFSTESGNLQINNETVFPLEAVNQKFPVLKAHQTRVDNGDALVDVPIDFTLSSEVVAKPRPHPGRFRPGDLQENGRELISIEFAVIGLAGSPIKSQTANAQLVHHDGIYTMVNLRTLEFNPTAPGEDDLEVCKTARNVQLCRVRLLANRKLREMMQAALERAKTVKEWMRTHGPGNKARPCDKFQGTGMKGGHRSKHGDKFYQHGHGHGHGHHHHKHGHVVHRILRAVFFMAKALVVPAILGFVVGFTISAIGMLVGQIIVFVWSRLYRGHRGPIRNRAQDTVEDGEKQELLVEEEPPAYEYHDEVPVYEDAHIKREQE